MGISVVIELLCIVLLHIGSLGGRGQRQSRWRGGGEGSWRAESKFLLQRMWGLLHSWVSADGKDHVSGSGVSKRRAESFYFSVQLGADIGTRWVRTHSLLLTIIPQSTRHLWSTTEWVQPVHALSHDSSLIKYVLLLFPFHR